MSKRALMFGGAFNPPTKAHIELADQARVASGCDFVIFVPSKSTYIKYDQDKNFVYKENVRLEMLRKIAKDKNWMIVSDYEIKLTKQPRTYVTLQYLRDQGYDVSLLLGSDKLPELETGWNFIPEIAKEFGIVCMVRDHDECLEMVQNDPFLSSLGKGLTIFKSPETYQDYSSTRVRKLLVEDPDSEELKEMIPEELDDLKEYRNRGLLL